MKKLILYALILFSINLFGNDNIPRFENEVFQKVGEDHNKYLEQFFQKCIDNPNYVSDLNSFYARIDEMKPDELGSSFPNSQTMSETETIENPKVSSAYNHLKEVLGGESYTQVKSSIETLKTETLNDASLSNSEFNAIMSMLYVAEYSSYFWMSTESGGSGKGIQLLNSLNQNYPQGVFMPSEPDGPANKVNWPKTRIEKDAMGAALGALEWCVTGSLVTPGVGTVAGFISGAVFYGIGASIIVTNPEFMCRKYPNDYCCILAKRFNFNPPLDYCKEEPQK